MSPRITLYRFRPLAETRAVSRRLTQGDLEGKPRRVSHRFRCVQTTRTGQQSRQRAARLAARHRARVPGRRMLPQYQRRGDPRVTPSGGRPRILIHRGPASPQEPRSTSMPAVRPGEIGNRHDFPLRPAQISHQTTESARKVFARRTNDGQPFRSFRHRHVQVGTST